MKLRILDDEVGARQRIANEYARLLSEIGFEPPYIEPFNVSAWAQFTLQSDDRDGLVEGLASAGIPSVVHYPCPLNKQPAVASSTHATPKGDAVAQRVFSLPFHPYLDSASQSAVVQCLK